ncbi:putative ribonuclease H protein [Citrus sinensis]|uniref:Ribonuclease H protein n=1 Tax=Citrus sinensis TaxID=2711 RepID=A0ACB8KA31_CITSI|nr:putative ribonuclease H protein [Citrus sinensis]
MELNPNLMKAAPPLLEEDRTTKKARFREQGSDENNPPVMSFRDSLMKDQSGAAEINECMEDLDIADEDVFIETDGCIPSVVFSQKMQEQLVRPWKNTVIVKLLGRSIGYRSLCTKLESLWRVERGFIVIDLENDYYLVRFGTEEDVEFALTQGPWTIFGHYLTVQKWSPSFDCLSDKIETVVAWIRLPGMPLHYYHKRVLRILGEVVGRVIRIDYNIEAAKRGKFARVAVEICLNKPLVSQFQLNGKIQRIEYEGLPTICFECGKYGHTVDTCQRQQEVPRGQGCDGVQQPEGEVTGVTVDPATVENPKNSLFGPWMIVAKKGRPQRAKEGTIQGDYNRTQNGNARSGSRFSLLNSEDNMDKEREISERIPSNHVLESNLDLQDENQNSNQPMQPNHRYPLRKHSQRSNRGNVAHPPSPSLVQLLKTRDNQPHLASTSLDPLKHSVYSFANPPDGTDMLTQFARANPLFADMSKDNRNNPLGEPPDNGGWNGIGGDEDSEGSTYVARGGVDGSRDDSESGGSLEEETDMELELQAHTPRQTFKALVQKYNPSMVALFEPRISGKKADEFIIRSGFERSHRIEAEGFSGVYASPNKHIRNLLWKELEAVARNVSGPWLLGGDFNTILHPSERRGGSPRSTGVCHRFNDWFHRNQFCDLDFSGPKFTWERGNLLKRLDRSFCNDEWVQKFANSQVMHLPKLDSDHRPILVKFERVSRQASGAKPFRFLASWLTDSRFKTFVSETCLMDLEVTLKRELESILSQEEILWFQKSRRDWIEFGDRNTKYFHRQTIQRRRQNQIVMLKDEHGNWIEDVDIIKAHAVTFFKDLYTKEPGEHIPYPLVSMFPKVEEINLGKLNAGVCEDDIREAIFSMHPFKAPGVDGLHAVFYQTQWETVGVSVWPMQTSFVPGRHITENIIIAQEVIHTMRRKSGKIGQMLIKVDLEKAYDRLSWDFIFETLSEAGIPSDLIRMTMECITSASMQILWNGDCTEEFVPSRGIRQGDPISLYIFVLCIERLSHGIHRAVNTGTWRPIRLSKRGTPITHVFFADDLLLFAEASCTQAAVINDVLNTFCVSSGAKVNKQKSQVFFSKNVNPCNVRNIGTTLGFSVTTDLGNYLGMPLLHSRVSKATYHGILEKVERKLNGWSAKFLSLAGRITLTQSVLQALPIYSMQTTRLPTSIITKIEQHCRRFIWSGNSEVKKLHLINWADVCRPKLSRGLGLKNLTLMNEALLMKLGWGLLVNSNSYWAQVLCSKYGFDPNTMSTSLPTKYGSYLWKAIGRICPKVLQGLRWNVRDDKRIRFWQDAWVADFGPLVHLAVAPIPEAILNDWVADAISVDGSWNWGRFGFLLPHKVVLMIAAIKPPSPDSAADQFYWGSSNSGMFTARTAYNLLLGNLVQDEEVRWKSIWKWRGPHRIRTFLWLVAKERIKCKAELYRRHIGVDMICMRCGYAVEDTAHALRDCATSRRIWNMLLTGHETADFFMLPTRDWIFANIQGLGNHGSNKEWSCIFGVAIWCIWVARNQLLFEDKIVNAESMVRDIRVRAEEIIRTSEAFQSDRGLRVQKMFSWLPPRWPYYKLNSDGARKGAGMAGAGGLIRDATGRWHGGFCMNIGICSVSIHHVYREANFAADFMASHALTLPLGLHYFTTPPQGVKTWLRNDGLGTAFPRVFKP